MGQNIPEKIDGTVTLIDYEQKIVLTEELQYFVDHLDGKKPKLTNGKHVLSAIEILITASKKLDKMN